MLYRLALAAALGLALTPPAGAQSTAQVLPTCGSASLPLGPGGRLYVDQTGNLCVTGISGGGGGGGATGSVTAAGTNGTVAQAVQGITGGVPVLVSAASWPLPTGAATSALQTTGNNSLASIDSKLPTLVGGRQPVDLPAAALTTAGTLEPPTAATGKVTATSTALTANTSTQIAAANTGRIALAIQCASGGVSVDERGSALAAAAVGNGTLFIPSGSAPYFTPPIASRTAITAYTATAQTCTVTEYLR